MDEASNSGAARKEIDKAVENMILVNPEVKSAFHSMCRRGLSRQSAEDEIGRALLGCMWEASRNMPDRWSAVLKGLAGGKSAMELFPDGSTTVKENEP
jgi:hypothetical protein